MNDISKNKEKQLPTQYKWEFKKDEGQDSDELLDLDNIELSDEQKVQQNLFLEQFTQFSTSKKPKFLIHDYELRLNEKIQLNSNLFQDICNFYKDQLNNAKQIKDKILMRLNNFRYSMNHLSLITMFFQSYSSFQNFCNSAQIMLDNQICQNPPYQIFEFVILSNILNTHRTMILKTLLVKFKHFSLIRRREILNIAVGRFLDDIKNEKSSIPILDNSREHVISELSRLSQILGINFDVDEHDGQHFIYESETLLSDFQRLRFSFNIVNEKRAKPSKLIDCINDSFMETCSKEELIIEAFENIIHPNGRYNIVVYNAINNKSFPSEQINAWVNLRFCRNRQLLSELEKSIKKLTKYRNKIYENFQIEIKEKDSTFCDKYISFIIEQILIFSSAVYVKSNKKADLDPLLEISLEKQLRYTNAKNQILSVFAEISNHSNSLRIKEFTDQIIEKRPNLVFSQFSFFELFERQIETLEKVGDCFSMLLNLQILTERQMASFYGSFYEPYQFGTFYSNQFEGEFNLSKFEVYPNFEKIINFFSIGPKIVDDICSSMSIKSIEYSDYIELAVWTQFLNEIIQFPEFSIFGSDFTSIHFNLPLSKDVESLINCRILDDPLFLKKFEAQIDLSSSLKSKFTQNLANFCLLALKLRWLIYKTDLYLPLYLRQFDEAYFSVGTTKTIEFNCKPFNFTNYEEIKKLCLNGDFSEIIEIINCQRRFNAILMIATQFNNFRSDNCIISFLFNVARSDNVFYMTKSETKTGKKAKLYQEASKRFFVGFESFIDQDFSTVFFDISDISNFNDIQKLRAHSKIYLNRIELATITNYERTLLHDFQQIELFSLNDQFYRPSDGFIDYFSIPNYTQSLLLDCDDSQFETILNLVSSRLKLISFVRFSSFIKFNRNRSFDLLNKHKIAWESSFLSKLKSGPKKSVSEALEMISCEYSFQMGRFLFGLLLLIQKVFQTKKAGHFQGKSKPPNLSLIADDEMRDLWRMANQEYLPNDQQLKGPFNSISIERYTSNFLARFNFTFSDILKIELVKLMDEIDRKVETNVLLSNNSMSSTVKASEFIQKEIVNELLKFAFLRLQTDFLFTKLDVISLVDITRREYKENLPSYRNLIVAPATRRLTSDLSKGVENEMLKRTIPFSIDSVRKLIEKAQRKQTHERSIQMSEQLEILRSCESPLKPEWYAKKKPFFVQRRETYNPNPGDAKRQFEQEMKYARSKIFWLIKQAMIHCSIHRENNDDANSILNLDSKSFLSKLKPVSSLVCSFVERSSDMILKTWPSYLAKSRHSTLECDEEDFLLNDMVKLIKNRYNMTLNFQLSVRNCDGYLKLQKLREIERTNNRQQAAYDEEIATEIQAEYEQKLDEIKCEQQEVLKKFPIVHDKYFKKFENVIEKQKEKVPQNEAILKPDHHKAHRSLQTPQATRDDKRKKKNIQISPSRSISAKDDSTWESPKMCQNRSQRRNTMVKSQTENSLFEKSKKDLSKCAPRRHAFSASPQRLREPLTLFERDEVEQPSAHKKDANSGEKLKEAERDINELRKTIIKLRITRFFFKIAVSGHYNKVMHKASQEKKEASMLLWRNRKSYEEDTREVKEDIENCIKRLSTAEKEIEYLKQELDAQRQVTTKLAHWKELNLRTSDQILKQIGTYQKGPNIEVSKLLKKLEEKREEMDELNKEAEEFENKLIDDVREPMNEASRIRRITQKQQYQNLKMKENLKNENSMVPSKIQCLLDENKKLENENFMLKEKISQLEKQKNQVPAVKIEATKELFESKPLPTVRRLKTSYVPARKVKTLTDKSPYAKFGYRSIKKPFQ